MTDDIAATLAPKSDQLHAIDLRGRPPQVFTITKVDVKSDPNADQPVSIHFAEFPRVWRPNVNMRRVLGHCWGTKSSAWLGRQVELYCDDSVTFGKETPGGTRISRLSHIDKPTSVLILLSKGKSGTWKVDPLPTERPPTRPTSPPASPALLADLTDTFAIKGIPKSAWLSGANQVTGGAATDLDQLTEADVAAVLDALRQRPDAEAAS